MALFLNKPSYPYKPIQSVAALARALRLEELVLISAAQNANKNYRAVPPKKGKRAVIPS